MEIIGNFYRELFESSNPSYEDITHISNLVQGRISEMTKAELDKPFCAQEVAAALKEIKSSKAPGIDGFNAKFYQKMWPIVGEEFTAEIL